MMKGQFEGFCVCHYQVYSLLQFSVHYRASLVLPVCSFLAVVVAGQIGRRFCTIAQEKTEITFRPLSFYEWKTKIYIFFTFMSQQQQKFEFNLPFILSMVPSDILALRSKISKQIRQKSNQAKHWPLIWYDIYIYVYLFIFLSNHVPKICAW